METKPERHVLSKSTFIRGCQCVKSLYLYVKGNASLKIYNLNEGFRVEALDEESKILLEDIRKEGLVNSNYVFRISQTIDGIDIDDRITKGVEWISKINNTTISQTSLNTIL